MYDVALSLNVVLGIIENMPDAIYLECIAAAPQHLLMGAAAGANK